MQQKCSGIHRFDLLRFRDKVFTGLGASRAPGTQLHILHTLTTSLDLTQQSASSDFGDNVAY